MGSSWAQRESWIYDFKLSGIFQPKKTGALQELLIYTTF